MIIGPYRTEILYCFWMRVSICAIAANPVSSSHFGAILSNPVWPPWTESHGRQQWWMRPTVFTAASAALCTHYGDTSRDSHQPPAPAPAPALHRHRTADGGGDYCGVFVDPCWGSWGEQSVMSRRHSPRPPAIDITGESAEIGARWILITQHLSANCCIIMVQPWCRSSGGGWPQDWPGYLLLQ